MTSLRRLYDRAVAGPDYPADAADRVDLELFGLAFPRRASLAVLITTAVIVIDELRWLAPLDAPLGATGIEALALERLVLFLVVPLAVVMAGFRDDPGRYGLRLGDWRAGAPLLLAGLVVMTPVILALAALPQFRGYYGQDLANPPSVVAVLTANLAELVPAEFLLRGFLMFALWRRIGPLALVVSLVPFVLTHIGKPEIELWSTFIGGSVFAWLNWRTGSILWSAMGHVYVLTLMTAAVGGTAGGGGAAAGG